MQADATLGDVVAMADQAATEEKWPDAIELYKKAVEMGKVSKESRGSAQGDGSAVFNWPVPSTWPESTSKRSPTPRPWPRSWPASKENKTGPMAASLAVTSAMNLYIISQGKPDELKRLQEVADFTIKSWPENAGEADDARIALGKVEMVQGRLPRGGCRLRRGEPELRPLFQRLVPGGAAHFRLYLMAKQAPPEKQDAAALTAHRDKTIQELVTSIKSRAQEPFPRISPLPRACWTACCCWARCIWKGTKAQAVPVLDPIFVQMQAQKPKELDKDTLHICLAAVKSYMSVKDLVKAESVATLLMDIGADEPHHESDADRIPEKHAKFEWKQAVAAVIQDPKNAAAKKVADANGAGCWASCW